MDTQTHFFCHPMIDLNSFLFSFGKINRQGTEQYKYNIFSGINKIEQITEYQQNLPLVL